MDDKIREIDIAYEVRDMLLDGYRMSEAIEYVKDQYELTDEECTQIEKTSRI